jgi:hypothetical protein
MENLRVQTGVPEAEQRAWMGDRTGMAGGGGEVGISIGRIND